MDLNPRAIFKRFFSKNILNYSQKKVKNKKTLKSTKFCACLQETCETVNINGSSVSKRKFYATIGKILNSD